MSRKIAAQGRPELPQRIAIRQDGVPARTESTLDAQTCDALRYLADALEALRAPVARKLRLVDLSDEQVVEHADDALSQMLSTAFPGADAPKTKTLTFQKLQVGIYAVRIHGTVTVHPFKYLPSLRPAAASHLKRITLQVEFIARMRLASDGRAHGDFEVAAVHYDTITALGAREAAIHGKVEPVARLASLVLGLHRSERWNEAVSTALLGTWTEPLLSGTGNCRSAMDRLETEAQTIHKQLTPLWRRKAGGSRLLLLDTPVGRDTTVYDLVAGDWSWEDASPYDQPDDARLGVLLRALLPEERAVVLAHACPGVASWQEAALLADAADPVAMGKRVRRKVNRLKARHKGRAAAAVRQSSVWETHSARLADGPESGRRGE